MPASELDAIALDHAQIMRAAGMRADPWQARVLRRRYQRLILNIARQVGKSTVIACWALIEMLYYAPALVLVLGPSERQSKELIRTVDKVRKTLGVAVDPERQSTTSMEFLTGSRIVALPSKEANIRGLAAVKLLVLDEASRIPDDVYNAVKPMLAVSQGRVALLSTPFGKRGFFHKEWTEGESWERIKVTAYECSRYDAAALELEKRSIPDSWFRQEYLCEFADNDSSMFRYEDVEAAMSDEVLPLFGLPQQTSVTDSVRPLFQ